MSALKFGDLDAIKQAQAATPLERMHLSFGIKKRKHCDTCRHYDGFMASECKLYRFLMNEPNYVESDSQACGKWERQA